MLCHVAPAHQIYYDRELGPDYVVFFVRRTYPVWIVIVVRIIVLVKRPPGIHYEPRAVELIIVKMIQTQRLKALYNAFYPDLRYPFVYKVICIQIRHPFSVFRSIPKRENRRI